MPISWQAAERIPVVDSLHRPATRGPPGLLRKEFFSKEVILDWMAQITLGLMTVHSKTILHRDIKAQNIFLVKIGSEEVVKIGDFGISRELNDPNALAATLCGTPFFMSPEVVKGERYNAKSDMWSLGCLMYELATLRKPFESETQDDLFDKIKHKEFTPFGPGIDPAIKTPIIELLHKDPTRRPNIWDFSKFTEINKRIHSFIQKHDCMEMVAYVLQDPVKIPSCPSGGESGKTGITEAEAITPMKEMPKEEKKSSGQVFTLNLAQIEELIGMIHDGLKIQNVKVSWLTTYENVTNGSTLHTKIVDKLGYSSENALKILQKLIDKSYLIPADGNKTFQNRDNTYYRFQLDRTDIADNMKWPWNYEF